MNRPRPERQIRIEPKTARETPPEKSSKHSRVLLTRSLTAISARRFKAIPKAATKIARLKPFVRAQRQVAPRGRLPSDRWGRP
ncbi:hypothetical protein GCM10010402_40910 [Actinomadura luteofluorescens]